MYNAFAVADWNLCPSGWHVSTDGDWVELEVAIGMSSTEANSTGYRGTDEAVKLASTNWFGTDEFGFTMMSSAWRDLSGGEYDGNGGGAAHFWTSTLGMKDRVGIVISLPKVGYKVKFCEALQRITHTDTASAASKTEELPSLAFSFS